MSRAALVIAAVLLVGCASRRHLDIEFTSADAGVTDEIARVDVEIFDGNQCTCADLDLKPGCMTSDHVSTITFGPGSGDRTGGGFPDGPLVLRISAYTADLMPLSLKYACYCAADRSNLAIVAPLGPPLNPPQYLCQ